MTDQPPVSPTIAIKGEGFDTKSGGFTHILLGDERIAKDDLLARLSTIAPGGVDRDAIARIGDFLSLAWPSLPIHIRRNAAADYENVQRDLAALSFTPHAPAGGEAKLREALGKHVVFNAYRDADPLAIRLQFANEVDRLAAANAIDAALSTVFVPAPERTEIETFRASADTPSLPPEHPFYQPSAVTNIPAGMKPWAGGDRAPDDWDGGGVLLRNGSTMFPSKVSLAYHANGTNRWDHRRENRNADWDIIAYTPKAAAPVATERLRPEVLVFAHLMEAQLRANDHKPGWKSDTPFDLWRRLCEETSELDVALSGEPVTDHVGREAADVANFAMMIADVCGALAQVDGEGSNAP